MKLAIGTQIKYTSAAGVRQARIINIHVGPTGKPGFLITWLTLEIPVQPGVKFSTTTQIPADDNCLKGFQVELLDPLGELQSV